MRVSPFIGAVLCTVLLMACSKEYSLETDQAPTPSVSGLLIGATIKDPLSEINFTYEYNAANLPLRNLYSLNAPGFTADGIIQATRDAAGKVNFSRIVLASNLTTGFDTINYEIARNASGKISHVLLKPADTSNTAGYDSIVYSYSASGKISGYMVYLIEYGTGQVEPLQAAELTWDGNNVVKTLEYEYAGTPATRQLVETISFYYDDKPAARALTEEDFIANLSSVNNLVPAVNNTVKYAREFSLTPSDNVITEYKYVYGTNGKPLSAEVTTIRPGLPDGKANLTFAYR